MVSHEALDPAIDRAPIDHDAPFGEPLHDVGVAQTVADVPSDGKSDHLIGEAMVRESARRACGETATALSATPALASQTCAPISPSCPTTAPDTLHSQPLSSTSPADHCTAHPAATEPGDESLGGASVLSRRQLWTTPT